MTLNGDVEITNTDELLLPVRPIKQEYKWDCGPAALRIVLKYQFGIKLTTNDVVLLTGATENGADEFNMIRALDWLGFKYKQTNYGTFNQLKSILQDGQTPIVHLVVEDGVGHYMVFCGYDEENVWLADPSKGKIVKYGIPYFMGIWKVEEKETQTRWFIVITGYVGDKLNSMIKRLKRIQKKIIDSRK